LSSTGADAAMTTLKSIVEASPFPTGCYKEVNNRIIVKIGKKRKSHVRGKYGSRNGYINRIDARLRR
jgi:hypothetical protein